MQSRQSHGVGMLVRECYTTKPEKVGKNKESGGGEEERRSVNLFYIHVQDSCSIFKKL